MYNVSKSFIIKRSLFKVGKLIHKDFLGLIISLLKFCISQNLKILPLSFKLLFKAQIFQNNFSFATDSRSSYRYKTMFPKDKNNLNRIMAKSLRSVHLSPPSPDPAGRDECETRRSRLCSRGRLGTHHRSIPKIAQAPFPKL